MLWPLRGFITIITLWDCRFRVSTLSIEHHFCWKSQFYRHSCQSPSILLICCLLMLLHVLLSGFLTFSVVCGSGCTRVVEEMSRFSSILLNVDMSVSSCWRMIPLHLWAKTAFSTRRLAEKSRRVERCNFAVGGGTSGSSSESCWEVFTLHPAKTKMTGSKIPKMGDFPACHVSFQRCIPESGCLTGFNCQCVFCCLQPVKKYVVPFQLWRILPKLTLTLEDFTNQFFFINVSLPKQSCPKNPDPSNMAILRTRTGPLRNTGSFTLPGRRVRSTEVQRPGNVGIYHRFGQVIRTFPAE